MSSQDTGEDKHGSEAGPTDVSDLSSQVDNTQPERPKIRMGASDEGKRSNSREKNKIEAIPADLLGNGEKKIRRLRSLFILTFLAGTVALYIGKGIGGWNILLSIGVMSVYWVLVSRELTTYNARMVFADSFYYLGFLFTFVALLISLLDLSDTDPLAIIGQMGPALASTIYGMLIRIYLTQFDAVVTEPDQDILAELGQLAERLGKTNQAFLESQKESMDIMQSFSENLKEIDLSSTVADLSTLNQSVSSMKGSVDKAAITFSGVRNSTENLNSNLENLNDRLRNLDDPTEKLNDVENKIQDQIGNIDKRMKSVSDSLGSVADGANQTIMEVDKKFTQLQSKVSSMNKSFDRFLRAFLDKLEDRN